jgi:DNA-binding transcriptional MerR regulator
VKFPSFFEDCLTNFVTRQEVITTLNSRDIPLTQRQLIYWEDLGLISRVGNEGVEVLYDKNVIDELAIIFNLRYNIKIIIKKLREGTLTILGDNINESLE